MIEAVRTENEKELREPDPDGTIERLMMSKLEKNDRIAALQKKVEIDLIGRN